MILTNYDIYMNEYPINHYVYPLHRFKLRNSNHFFNKNVDMHPCFQLQVFEHFYLQLAPSRPLKWHWIKIVLLICMYKSNQNEIQTIFNFFSFKLTHILIQNSFLMAIWQVYDWNNINHAISHILMVTVDLFRDID